ncbi:MAG: glycosyl transferase, partial [Thermoanaerobaculia bacterium]
VPDRVARATLALEDRRFDWHPGVDLAAAARALRQNLAAGRRVSGASTLAMQVARMQAPGARGYLRKAVEAATAVLITARYGRSGVLRHYLRIVPYGNRIHGIAYAARRYLDKPVEDLSWAEIAFLCAIPQSPARMNPYLPAGRARAIRRGRAILERLARSGEISTRERVVALAEIDSLALPWRAARPAATLHPLLALAGRVSEERRRQRPLLDTTLDLELQSDAEWVAHRAVTDAAGRGAGNAAAIVVERAGWRVVAAVGSTGYFDDASAGAIDYLRLPRSSGSTLKPFLFAAALERGALSPASVLDDLGPGPGGIVNSDDRFLGPMLPRAALANSRNVPAALLAARLGPDPLYALYGDLGLHAYERPAGRYGLGLAIGALPVTLERLIRAYTTLAGDGTLAGLAWLAGEEPATPPERVFSEATARLVTLFLADPQARLPTFPRMGATEYPFPVAVKTGTSSRYRDAWTVAWSKRYLVGVWVGHPDERPMARLSGYRISARVAHDLLERLHRDEPGFEDAGFPPPTGWRVARLCALTGAHATAACDRTVLEWL